MGWSAAPDSRAAVTPRPSNAASVQFFGPTPSSLDAVPGRSGPVWQALGALGLLSVVPLPRRAHGLPTAVTLAAFAPAGLALGGVLAGVEVGLAHVLPLGARSAVLLAALVVLSGAMHLDGLMDSVDGLFGAGDRARRLDVMRDSRVGAYGVAAAVAVILVQFAALSGVTADRSRTLVVCVGLSRAMSALALGLSPPARRDGLGNAFAVPHRLAGGTVAAALAIVAAVLLTGWRGVATALTTLAVSAAVVAVFRRRVGGMTGDGFGAVVELALAGALLCFAARL